MIIKKGFWFCLIGFLNVNCYKSKLDCNFDYLTNAQDSGFCEWRPNFEGSKIWHTGNAVLVDSANSIVHTSVNNRFAFVQGKFDSPMGGQLESPLIRNGLNALNELKLSYWKTDAHPIMDICLKDASDEALNCIDSIIGPGQPQWVQRSIELPKTDLPFQIILRARNILSAEDIICIDDIQLVNGDNLQYLNDNNLNEQKEEITNKEFILSHPEKKEKTVSNKLNWPSKNATHMFPESAIRPQIQMPPSPALVYSQPSIKSLKEQPFLFDLSLNEQKKYEKQTPQIEYSASNYPEFISLADGMNPDIRRKEEQEGKFCRAIKCSFMDNSCLWNLGPTWQSSDGNMAKDTAGEDSVTSAAFKIPVAAYIQFDLWMSDNSHLMLLQQVDNPTTTKDNVMMLFSRRGMANNGWHRFRVPLRSSFKPVTIKFRSILPENAFVTISNTRLVNEKDEEMSCEMMADKEFSKSWISQTNGIPKTTTMQPSSITLFPTPKIPFNPFKPMFENGLAPIIPQRDDLPRLTAFQNFNQFTIPTIQPIFLSEFHPQTTPTPIQSNHIFATLIPSTLPFNDDDPIKNKLTIMSADETFHPDSEPIRLNGSFNSKQSIESLLQSIAGQPVLEQQLRYLAKQLGYDANSNFPDRQTIEALRSFVGTKLMNSVNSSPLPTSVASTNFHKKNPFVNNINVGEDNKLPEPLSIPTNFKPIFPVNNQQKDFEEIGKEENIRNQPKAWLDNLADLINPRGTVPNDPQLPLKRENLDFVFQNALNG